MNLKKIVESIWNSWWFKPLFASAAILAIATNLRTAELAIPGILLAFALNATWAGIRKKRETNDYKKILLAGYVLGVILAISFEFVFVYNNCDENGVCVPSLEIPPYRYTSIYKYVTGETQTKLEYVWESDLQPLVLGAFIAAGIASALVAVAAAKYLAKEKTKA